jgi:hypothetical protein
LSGTGEPDLRDFGNASVFCHKYLNRPKLEFSLYQTEKVKYYILLYPEDLKAKIYEFQDNKYEKNIDLLEGSFEFDNLECAVKVDFDFVFERLR